MFVKKRGTTYISLFAHTENESNTRTSKNINYKNANEFSMLIICKKISESSIGLSCTGFFMELNMFHTRANWMNVDHEKYFIILHVK